MSKNKFISISIMIFFINLSAISTPGNIIEHVYKSTLIGNMLYVGGNGPNNYSKIQDAIDNAPIFSKTIAGFLLFFFFKITPGGGV